MIQGPSARPTVCVVGHTTYGLTMADGLWHASCACGWRSVPSPDLAGQTDELDRHLRVVVTEQQRPGRVEGVVTASVLQVVDHTLALGVLAACLAVAAPLAARSRAS